jgi:hypothetical protein
MSRIILGLAAGNYVLVVITAVLGLMSNPGDVGASSDPFRYHFPMGIFTALYTVLVHCLVFTYFLGVGRWVRETAYAYGLGTQVGQLSNRYRRRAVGAAVGSVLCVVATIASGAAAHTRVWPVLVHQIVPVATYVLMFLAYGVEVAAIEQHAALTEQLMTDVRARREQDMPEAPDLRSQVSQI